MRYRVSRGVRDRKPGTAPSILFWFSPSASFVLQGAAVLWSSPDQVNDLGDTTRKYRLDARTRDTFRICTEATGAG